MTEIWKTIPSAEGRYEASNLGRIRSLGAYAKARAGGIAFRKGRVLAQSLANRRYAKVTICGTFGRKEFSVHRLVAEAWHGPCPEGQIVRHLDGNACNNYALNLAYGSCADNVQDRHRHGRYPVGEKHHRAVLRESDALLIFRNEGGASVAKLAFLFGVSESTVYAIRNGHRWAHVTKGQ